MRRIGVALLGLMLCFGARAALPAGATPPDALGTTQRGQSVTVSSLRGKVVVISFWATWCGYCMKEMPVLANLLITWDSDGAIGHPYGTDQGIPVMVMLHRDGTVAHTHVGYGEDMIEELVAEINALLDEPLPAATVAAAH